MRRTKEEVIINVLEACLAGSNKTTVVHRCNLNFNTVTPYLEILMKNKLIELIDDNSVKYKITDKGKEFLAMLKEIHALL